MHGDTLIRMFGFNAEIVQNQMEDVSHAESLQPEPGSGHTLNWLLGHIISARTFPLRHVGAAPVWDLATRARYRNGSLPVSGDEAKVLPIDTLMEKFSQSQTRLVERLGAMSDPQLLEPSGYGENTIYDSLIYFHFHEAYHVGQLTLVAAHIGKTAAYLKLD